jgi:hypothetical protein
MVWRDVCRRGRPAGGRVREDDIPRGEPKEMHDAGGPSPGIEKFIREVVRMTPLSNTPPKPADFPTWVDIQTYPGRGAADVHYEGRAADIFLSVLIPAQKASGDWLFDWCVANCTTYQIQGIIFGKRRWFLEYHGGTETVYAGGDHDDHVHVELNGAQPYRDIRDDSPGRAGHLRDAKATVVRAERIRVVEAGRHVSMPTSAPGESAARVDSKSTRGVSGRLGAALTAAS